MSKPEDIPQDIWDNASRIADEAQLESYTVWAIARAILAERERCASIAGYGTTDEDWHPDSIMGTYGARIARLIRAPSA